MTDAYLSPSEVLDLMAANTESGGGAGLESSDLLLNQGVRGLRFFEAFLPAYRAWTSAELDFADVYRTYDELRGISFSAFRAESALLGGAGGTLGHVTEELKQNVGGLGDAWDGSAAEAANAYTATFLQGGETVSDRVGTVGALLGEGVRAIEGEVLKRARGVLELGTDNIGGMFARDVDLLVRTARQELGVESFAMLEFVPLFAPHRAYLSGSRLSFEQKVKIYAHLSMQWLTDVFVPTVEETLGSFTQICAATKTAVDAQWSAIVEGMRGLPDTHFERATISPSGEPEIHVDWAPVDLGGSGGAAGVAGESTAPAVAAAEPGVVPAPGARPKEQDQAAQGASAGMGGMPMMPMGGPMPGAEDIERKSKRPAPPQDDFFGADLPPYADVEKLVDPDAVL